MHSETKKFLRNRRIAALLPWLGILGILILTFSPIFGGFVLFFTEIGFVASFYFFIDEYNWLAERLLIRPNYTVNHENEDRVKKLFYFALGASIVYAILLSYLRSISFYDFVVGVAFLYGIYFGKHNIEYALIILRAEFGSKKYYVIQIIGTLLTAVSLLAFYFVFNWIWTLSFLAILGFIYVLERNILKEMKNHGVKIHWDDDDTADRFSIGN
ncbi:hypothetical protein B1745_06950 [Lactobacillus amylolyticus]|uniref:hypothetical protein n=1 Tax=Lactobacillus amylolyticus TaxID=83683 RepID=UPI0009B996B0|nr:hypothetical protein [Lactobacillus amylolyticus]ARD07328.1 hypothetical protein B1745_06950 [Lactobacillus amylolyticus]